MTKAAKLALYIIGGLVLGIVIVFLVWNFDPFGRRKKAEVRAVTAEQAENLATETAQITERTFRTETIIHETAEPIIQTIEAAPGADTPIPDDVLGPFLAGIASVRGDAQAVDDPGSRDAGEPLPAPRSVRR